jgi:hypothetical protein
MEVKKNDRDLLVPKKSTSTRALVSWKQGRLGRSIDVPALTANIFAAVTNRTNKISQFVRVRDLKQSI